MNRLSLAAAASALLLTVSGTAFAATITPLPAATATGKTCEGLFGVQRKVCMGATISSAFENKIERRLQRTQTKMTRKMEMMQEKTVVRGNKRSINLKELERQRKFLKGEAEKKEKDRIEWMKKHSSSSSSMMSSSSSAATSSSSSAMSSSSSTSSTGSSSSAMSSSSSSK